MGGKLMDFGRKFYFFSAKGGLDRNRRKINGLRPQTDSVSFPPKAVLQGMGGKLMDFGRKLYFLSAKSGLEGNQRKK